MATNDNAKVAKSCTKFYCENCDYKTMRKSSLDKHNMTAKHIKTTNDNAKVAKSCTKYYSCNNCDKDFNDRTGLWRHKKKCQMNNVDVVDVVDVIDVIDVIE